MRRELCFIFGFLFLMNFVNAEMLISDAGVQYDSSIIDRFDNGSSSVLVSVEIKDNSGIIIEGTSEQRNDLIELKEEWERNKTEEVFAALSEGEMSLRLDNLGVGWFEGNITKSGFEKLINNSDIHNIDDMTGAYPAGAHTMEDQMEQESNVSIEFEFEEQDQIKETRERSFSFFWIIFVIIFLIFIALLFKFYRRRFLGVHVHEYL